jgi:hypothetical protein
MKSVKVYLVIYLLCLISIPAQAANFDQLKKSFSRSIHQFLACLKGDKNCSPQSVKAVRAGTALVGTFLLLMAGSGAYYIAHKRKSSIPLLSGKEFALHEKLRESIFKKKDYNEAQNIIDQGADLETLRTFRGVSRTTNLLGAAATLGDKEAVALILKLGATIDAQDPEFGDTALMMSISNGHHEIATYLIDQGANIQAQNKELKNPLMLAAAQGNPQMVQVLLNRDADRNTKDAKGKTALQIAQEHLEAFEKLPYKPSPIINPEAHKKMIEGETKKYRDIIKLLE